MIKFNWWTYPGTVIAVAWAIATIAMDRYNIGAFGGAFLIIGIWAKIVNTFGTDQG